MERGTAVVSRRDHTCDKNNFSVRSGHETGPAEFFFFAVSYAAPFQLVLYFILDRLDRAFQSARETLRKARSQFQNASFAEEHKELFG